jgi:UDP-N-acetylmuramoyl-L-alanyl-D-glutamate--2,6-diaminopimelate ligase
MAGTIGQSIRPGAESPLSSPDARPHPPVLLRRLLTEIDVLAVSNDADIEVTSIEYDSRRVQPGAAFFCLPGQVTDGHQFAAQAVEKGAVVVVCERAVELGDDHQVVQVRVAPGTARPSMAQAAAAFYGHPCRQLLMAGVTGTNGKTTVSHLIAAVLRANNIETKLIGTLSGPRTTPEAPELEAMLAAERDLGVADGTTHAVAMEVSSHALAQARVDGLRFDVAVFTNLSHDHLDFHPNMEAYFEAKASLFTPERAAQGVVFVDDPAGARLAAMSRIAIRPVSSADAAAVDLGLGWSRFVWRGRPVELGLTGRFNVDNALLAAEASLLLGIEIDDVAAGLSESPPVAGRLEPVVIAGDGIPFSVMVDFAHTPAALEAVLVELRRLIRPEGRVLVVFGCGGNRDQAKRPLMGEVAARLADVAFVTSDNPRDEDPLRIIDEIRSGIDATQGHRAIVEIEPDRASAISAAIALARADDVVLLAGKGHETTQEIRGVALPFDDRSIAEEVLGCSR